MRLSFKLLLISELVLLTAVLILVGPVWWTMRGLSHSDISPGALVKQLNRLLADDLVDGWFITLFYVHEHVGGPSRTDDVTLLCVDRV